MSSLIWSVIILLIKQIGLPLRSHPILSLVWLQTELDSTQSCDHYLLSSSSLEGLRTSHHSFRSLLANLHIFDNSCLAVRSLVMLPQGTQIKCNTKVTQMDNIYIHVVYFTTSPQEPENSLAR